MLNTFIKYFEGYFNNQTQAFTYPRDFALIQLTHTKISDYKFLIEQSYIHENSPYRVSIINVTQVKNKILLQSYKNDSQETYTTGCDVLFEYNKSTDTFHGKNTCKECFVDKGGMTTYLLTEAFLTNDIYTVVDRGMNPETHEQVWGSFTDVNNGFYIFDRK
jgi:CpeT protein